MKRLFRWFGIALLVLLVPLVLVLGAVAYLGGTERGVNLAAREAAKRLDGLELGAFRGTLIDGLATESLSFENDTLKLRASGVDTAWRLGCLTALEFCLDRAIIDELVVETSPSETPEEPEPAPSGGIALPEISLPIDVTAKEVLIRTLRFRPPGGAPEQVLENVALSARTEGSRVLLDNASVRYDSYEAALAGEVTLAGDYPLDLTLGLDLPGIVPESAISGAEASGDAVAEGDADTAVEGEAGDEVPDETPGEAPATRDLRVDVALGNTLRALDVRAETTGAVAATLEGRVEPLDPALPAELSLSLPAVGWPIDTEALLAARDVGLSVDGTLDDYALALGASLSGEQVPDTDIALSGRANTERLELADIDIATLGGSIGGDAALSWADGIDWRAAIDLAGIDPSVQLETLAGELGGELRASGAVTEAGGWTLDLQRAHVEGMLQGHPFLLDAALSKGEDELFRIGELALDNGRNRIRAEGSVGDSWDIASTIALPELRTLWPGLAGGFDATLDLSGPLAEPSAALEASAGRITFNDLLVRGFELRADVARGGIEPSAANLAVEEVLVAGQRIANVRLGLDGTRESHTLSLFADGPQATAVDLEAEGSLNETFDWLGRLRAVTLELPAHVVRLREPAELAWNNADARFSVAPHCWVSEETNLCLENAVEAGAEGTARVTIDRYLLERLDPFLPAGSNLNGSLAADADVAWGPGQPGGFSAVVALGIEDGGATVIDANEEPVTFTYDDLTLRAEVDPTDVRANLAVSSETMGEAAVVVRLDPATEGTPIDGTVSLDGFRIDFVQAFAPQLETVSGTLNADGKLSGELADPRFDGSIVLADPVVRADTLPLPIEGGRIVVNVRGKRAIVDGSLASSGEGEIGIAGSANWQRIDAWRASVTLTGEALAVRQAPLTDSTVNHDITISARPGRVQVSGDVDVPFATINVRELPQGAATLSDDIVVVEDLPEETDEPGGSVAPAGLDLIVDVEVALGDDVSVDAYGLTANLTGDIGVSLRTPNPVQLGGEITVVDGVFKQYGQNLEATGQILFVGPIDSTALDIEAIRRIESEEPERIAGLRITGTIDSPDIELFTEPGDKSEEAILSYIVLGRDLGAADDQSASLLTSAALALSVKGGKTLGSGIADSLGIEDFAFETQGRGESTELVASGRINDRLLLRYGQSVFEPGRTLYLRYDLTRNLYLEAANSVSQSLSQAVDLFYKFSF